MSRRALVLAPLALMGALAIASAQGIGQINEYSPLDVYTPGDPLPMTMIDKVPGADKRPRKSFVGCPIIQDSEPTPCWLIEHEGETYFLRAQQNLSAQVHHPQLKHRLLVEGVVSDEPRICGGIVLNPLSLSVMRELDPSCDERRPAVTGVGVALAKRPPGPGPSGGNREARNTARMALRDRLNKPAGEYVRDDVPREKRSFDAPYGFDSDFTYSYPIVMAAAKFAKDVMASQVEVHVFRGSALLSDGTRLVERAAVVDDRQAKIAEILAHYFIEDDKIRWILHRTPAEPDGTADHANRFVRIIVKP